MTAAARTFLDLHQSRDFVYINMVTWVTLRLRFSLKYINLPYPAFSVETKRKQDYAEYYDCVNNHLFAFRILYLACDLVCMCRALSNWLRHYCADVQQWTACNARLQRSLVCLSVYSTLYNYCCAAFWFIPGLFKDGHSGLWCLTSVLARSSTVRILSLALLFFLFFFSFFFFNIFFYYHFKEGDARSNDNNEIVNCLIPDTQPTPLPPPPPTQTKCVPLTSQKT